jgi:hypothetical protein
MTVLDVVVCGVCGHQKYINKKCSICKLLEKVKK